MAGKGIRLIRDVPEYRPQKGVVYRLVRGEVDAVIPRETFERSVVEAGRVLAQMKAEESRARPIPYRRRG
jgi:hypothetical protein